jgi:hypothetical protein
MFEISSLNINNNCFLPVTKPEKVIDRVRVIFEPPGRLQQLESRADEGLKHSQQTLHTTSFSCVFVHQNAAQVQETTVFVHSVQRNHLKSFPKIRQNSTKLN